MTGTTPHSSMTMTTSRLLVPRLLVPRSATRVAYRFGSPVLHLNLTSASRDNCTVGGDGGCRVGEVRAGTTSPMPDHKGFKLQ